MTSLSIGPKHLRVTRDVHQPSPKSFWLRALDSAPDRYFAFRHSVDNVVRLCRRTSDAGSGPPGDTERRTRDERHVKGRTLPKSAPPDPGGLPADPAHSAPVATGTPRYPSHAGPVHRHPTTDSSPHAHFPQHPHIVLTGHTTHRSPRRGQRSMRVARRSLGNKEVDIRARAPTTGPSGTNRSPETDPNRHSDIRALTASQSNRLTERPTPIFPAPGSLRNRLELLT